MRLPTDVEAVAEFARAGSVLERPEPSRLGDVLVTTSWRQARQWLSGEYDPAGRDEEDFPEDHRDWVNLREEMASRVWGDAYDADRANELEELNRELSGRIEESLSDRGRPVVDDFVEDILADLIHVAMSRFLGCEGEHAQFFELLFRAYEAGVLPCGWDGDHPSGRLAVFSPLDDEAE